MGEFLFFSYIICHIVHDKSQTKLSIKIRFLNFLIVPLLVSLGQKKNIFQIFFPEDCLIFGIYVGNGRIRIALYKGVSDYNDSI